MAPLLLSRKEVDDARWNATIAASEQAIAYGFSWYLDIVCEDWAAVIWPSLDDYQVMMPLPVKKKWGLKIIYQPFFCQYLGIFAVQDVSQELVESFLKAADSFTDFISAYHFSPENHPLVYHTLPQLPHWQTTVNHTHWLELGVPYEIIAARFSRDRRVNLKRATRCVWEAERSEDVRFLVILFQQNHEKNIEGGIRKDTYESLLRLLQYLLEYGHGELWYATQNGKPEAGIFIGKTARKVIYLFNASSLKGRQGNARTFLLDRYFQNQTGEEMIFDFESPEVSSITRFYDSFGAQSKPFFSVRKNSFRFPFKQLYAFRAQILRVWKWL